MITVQNYFERIGPRVGSLTAGQREVHQQIEAGALDFYDDPEIKETIDLYLRLLNETHGRAQDPPAKRGAARWKRAAGKKTVPPPKPAAEPKPTRARKPAYAGKLVEAISKEVEFCRRYVRLHQRPKTRKQLAHLLNALKRAILARQITKDSPFAAEIRKMQEALVKVCNALPRDDSPVTLEINDADLARYVAMAGGEKVYPSIGYLKRYLRLQGTTPEAEKVNALYSQAKAHVPPDDPYYGRIEAMLKNLARFARQSEVIALEAAELSGLRGILSGIDGCACQLNGLLGGDDEMMAVVRQHQALEKGVMSLAEAARFRVRPLKLASPYKELIGHYSRGSHLLVYGRKGQGKTTFLLPFAAYLANHHGRTAYVSGEQFASGPFSDLIKRLGIRSQQLDVVAELNKIELGDYTFVFIDSKEAQGLTLPGFKQLKKDYPLVNFILVSQVNKAGDVRGTEEWGHEVDALIRVADGQASTVGEKNRMGGSDSVAIRF